MYIYTYLHMKKYYILYTFHITYSLFIILTCTFFVNYLRTGSCSATFFVFDNVFDNTGACLVLAPWFDNILRVRTATWFAAACSTPCLGS